MKAFSEGLFLSVAACLPQERLSIDSSEQTPQMSETLKDFFERTKHYWMEKFYNELPEESRMRDLKIMRRGGFELASTRYETVNPILQRLQHLELRQQQEEQGDAASSKKVDKGGV